MISINEVCKTAISFWVNRIVAKPRATAEDRKEATKVVYNELCKRCKHLLLQEVQGCSGVKFKKEG